MKAWPIFLRLQTSYAYGDGVGGSSPNTANEHAMLAEYRERIERERGLSPSLLIGPGGPDEVRVMRPDAVLTAHMPEADAIRLAVDNVMVDVGDIHEMPYSSGYFSFLHASNVLEHCLAPYIALVECRRVLKAGGVASFVLPSFEGREGGRGPFHLHCLTREVWTELLHKTGLVLADVHVQQGVDDSTAHYVHYRCIAGRPPHPHDKILNEVITCRATQ